MMLRSLFTALAIAGLAVSANAGNVNVLVGDMNDYGGLCTSDVGGPGTCNWSGTPYNDTDARDAADLAATNGAQYTDEYDALGYGPTPEMSISFLMPFTGTIHNGIVTLAVADLQPQELVPLQRTSTARRST